VQTFVCIVSLLTFCEQRRRQTCDVELSL